MLEEMSSVPRLIEDQQSRYTGTDTDIYTTNVLVSPTPFQVTESVQDTDKINYPALAITSTITDLLSISISPILVELIAKL